MSKKVLIFGAGYAGIEAALTLQKKKKPSDDIEISIIDKNSYHTLLTELHEVAGNRISEDGVIVPLRDIFKYSDVKIIKDEVKTINFETKKVVAESTEYDYDYLVISAGSEPNTFGIPGMKEYSFFLWSFEDAKRIREQIKNCFVKASQEKNADKRKAMLTFIVGGGGFSGVETVGEIALWVKQLCRQYNVERKEVSLKLVEALPNILNNLGENGRKKAMDYMQGTLKVDVMLNSAVSKVNEDSIELKSGEVIKTNTLIWTAGVKASGITNEIDIEKSRAARLVVNEYTETQHKNVYAIGDISAFTEGDKILPALVEAAVQTGKAAAKNIIADIRGKEKEVLKPKFHGVMVSIGSFFAVSEIMGKELPRFISIIMKYMVNVHYLFGIGGFELVIKYLRHEFFNKEQDKFHLEKHYSRSSLTFWLVPLRLYLGYTWLLEGLNKITEGWLNTAMLAGRAPDAGSSASVTETGEKVFRIVAAHTPGWYEWIANTLVVPNALLFQILIVVSEIGLGLAFISGSFTFLAGLVALGLSINFIMSTGLLPETWWMIPAAIAMLAGPGRAFGVDYYLMPYLMRQWRYYTRNNRIKLFLFK
ncbi:MAG: FAD-dependent pyridine nucleotide-disulfide oxidoreductase [Clostridiales bacterium]|jgi:NADH dehydrogenase|nr:FAD-dependent pyridine nucleotide-disulfide oxidoreductase [Clostridiales bacterium]